MTADVPDQPARRWTVTVADATTSAVLDTGGAPGGDAVILAHGASSNMEHRTVASLAGEFVRRGFDVVRFNFLYTEQKRSPPDRMPRLTECYAAVAEEVRRRLQPRRLFPGGHSMGGRAASVLAADGFACDGLVLLAYPLHPAGQPEKLRDAHLASIRRPVLCLNGTRDPLCEKELMERVVERLPTTWTMHWLKGADHSFQVLKRSGRTVADVLAEIGATTRGWVDQAAGGAGE